MNKDKKNKKIRSLVKDLSIKVLKDNELRSYCDFETGTATGLIDFQEDMCEIITYLLLSSSAEVSSDKINDYYATIKRKSSEGFELFIQCLELSLKEIDFDVEKLDNEKIIESLKSSIQLQKI
jgi:hypothetical protein